MSNQIVGPWVGPWMFSDQETWDVKPMCVGDSMKVAVIFVDVNSYILGSQEHEPFLYGPSVISLSSGLSPLWTNPIWKQKKMVSPQSVSFVFWTCRYQSTQQHPQAQHVMQYHNTGHMGHYMEGSREDRVMTELSVHQDPPVHQELDFHHDFHQEPIVQHDQPVDTSQGMWWPPPSLLSHAVCHVCVVNICTALFVVHSLLCVHTFPQSPPPWC